MRLYLFPPSSRSLGVVALKNHLAIECELVPVDLSRGDQRAAEYVAINPNRKVPTLEDAAHVAGRARSQGRRRCRDVRFEATGNPTVMSRGTNAQSVGCCQRANNRRKETR